MFDIPYMLFMMEAEEEDRAKKITSFVAKLISLDRDIHQQEFFSIAKSYGLGDLTEAEIRSIIATVNAN